MLRLFAALILIGASVEWYRSQDINSPRVKQTLRDLHTSVAEDYVEQYKMVLRNEGSSTDLCVRGGVIVEAYLAAHDAENYKRWTFIRHTDCTAAGIDVR
jgi:thiamine biosynthesis protein ThiC